MLFNLNMLTLMKCLQPETMKQGQYVNNKALKFNEEGKNSKDFKIWMRTVYLGKITKFRTLSH